MCRRASINIACRIDSFFETLGLHKAGKWVNYLLHPEAKLHNIINPHCFAIKEATNGDIVLNYKNWSRDKTWKPSNVTDEGDVMLQA